MSHNDRFSIIVLIEVRFQNSDKSVLIGVDYYLTTCMNTRVHAVCDFQKSEPSLRKGLPVTISSQIR